MELFEAIFSRRSVRQFENRPVPDDLIEKAIRAAMMAPSAGNGQPWQFVVVDDRALLNKVAEIHPHASMSRDAAAAVLVCGDVRLERYPDNWPLDCSAATQNLLLALHGMGLGAVWVGVFPGAELCEAFQALFELPASVVPLAFVPLGYPAAVPATPDRFKPERVHRNGFGG